MRFLMRFKFTILALFLVFGYAVTHPQAVRAAAARIASWTKVGRGTIVWEITGNGDLMPGANATYDIGNSTIHVANEAVDNVTGYGVSTLSGNTTLGGPVSFGAPVLVNATNTTIPATCSTLIYITNITGNHTLQFAPSANVHTIVDVSSKLGIVGNFTINGTSGTTNNATSVVWTNITATKSNPKTGTNVTDLRVTGDGTNLVAY